MVFCVMLRIIDILKEVSEAAGLSFYFGHVEELVNMINADGAQNIPHMPALFLPMDLSYKKIREREFSVRLDVLIAVSSDNIKLPPERFATTMAQLDGLRALFERELSMRAQQVTNVGGTLRPKVADSWNMSAKNRMVFNEAMDAIEITCDVMYYGCTRPLAPNMGAFDWSYDRSFDIAVN
jgi:hypothetical protein